MSENKAVFFKHRNDVIDILQTREQLKRVCIAVWVILIFAVLYESNIFDKLISFEGAAAPNISMQKKPRLKAAEASISGMASALLTLSKTMPEYRNRLETERQGALKALSAVKEAKAKKDDDKALNAVSELVNNIGEILNNPVLKQQKDKKNAELAALKKNLDILSRDFNLKIPSNLRVKAINFSKTPYVSKNAAGRNLFAYQRGIE